jgi:hypothetical protein
MSEGIRANGADQPRAAGVGAEQQLAAADEADSANPAPAGAKNPPGSHAVTPFEYTDPARFPLTTQVGLPVVDPLLLDAVNRNQLREARDLGRPLTAEQERAEAELEEKARHRAGVLARLKAVRR